MEKLHNIALAIMVLTPIVSVALVLRYRWFLKQLREEEAERQKTFSPMLSEVVPYEKYKRICLRGPVRSSAIRNNGDFLDFMLEHSDESNPNNIESNLANVDVGETTL